MTRCFFNIFIAGLTILAPNLTAQSAEELGKEFPDRVHQYVRTRLGKTHYQSLGKPSQPVVLLVHGVSGPMHVWDKNMDALTAGGFRVVRFDLYGRGLSERLTAKYDLSTYVEQMDDLLRVLNIHRPVHIVGSSFGAVLAAEYALRHPKRVKSLVFIGPAGFPLEAPFLAKLRDVPVIGDLAFFVAGKRTILEQNRKYFHDEKPPEDFWKYFSAQLDVPGTAEAMRETMRNSPVENYIDSYGELGKKKIPIDVIWGKKDATFPYSNHIILKEKIPDLKLITVEYAAHLPQLEQPSEVNAKIVPLLKN